MENSAGVHLIVDARVRDGGVFTKENLGSLFLELVEKLGMRILLGPEFLEVPVDPEVLRRVELTGNFEDEGGITGMCVISTSHLSVHCWPLQGFFSLDAFSCKDFDTRVALNVIVDRLGVDVDRMSFHVVNRKKPPAAAEAAAAA